MQSKKHSALESVLNVGSGFLLAMFLWQVVVAPLYGYEVSIQQNIGMTTIFTVASVLRGYVWRRLFNWHTIRLYRRGECSISENS